LFNVVIYGPTKHISDSKILELCAQYGAAVLEARRKFLGLLPEVARRRLWEQRGFGSVFEFAAKLAGVSEEQVRNVLNLSKKFHDLPVLQEKLVNGDVSVNKLIRITGVVNPENEMFWADQVDKLSQNAVETLFRDMRQPKDQSRPQLRAQLAVQEYKFVKLPIEVAEELERLQQMGMDVAELLRNFLKWREEALSRKEEKIEQKMVREIKNRSRYVPVIVKKLVQEKYGDKCAVNGCTRHAENLHHVYLYAEGGDHLPRNFQRVCRGHHELAHGGKWYGSKWRPR